MKLLFIQVGSNQGDRLQQLKQAVSLIGLKLGRLRSASAIYETEAWGLRDQADFLNACIAVETDKDPNESMRILLGIEAEMGRERKEKWSARKIDLDILLFEEKCIYTNTLRIPHPRMQERRFVLEPLSEIAKGHLHPSSGLYVEELLSRCSDPLRTKRLDLDQWWN